MQCAFLFLDFEMGEPVGVGEVDDALLITTEYRKEKTWQVTWSSKFVVEFVYGRKSVNRKCIKCSTVIKSNDGSTSAMAKHTKLCDPSEDHIYVGSEILSFQDFNSLVEKDVFDLMEFLEKVRPASVDPERLFSFCRLSEKFLQNRLSPENHSRNVFLNKNKHFLK